MITRFFMIWGPRNTEKGFLFLAALAALGLPWSLTHSLTVGFKAFQPSRPNPNLAKLMGIMRKHDMTNKKTKTKTMTNTFREHLQRAIFETFHL